VKGVFPAFPTIFDKEGKLLLDDMDNLLEFAKNSGVDGIFLHLVGGEYYKLELEERKRSIIAAVNLAPLGLPIYVNASSQSFNTSLEIIKLCEQIGVNGIILNSPYFSPLKGENAAFSAVTLNLISKTDLPVILQFYDPEPPSSNTILRNFLSHENVVAVKLEGANYLELAKETTKTGRHVDMLGGMYSYDLEKELNFGFSGTVPGLSIARHIKRAFQLYEQHKTEEFRRVLDNIRPIQKKFLENFDSFPYFERFALHKMGLISVLGYRMPTLLPSAEELRSFELLIKNILLTST